MIPSYGLCKSIPALVNPELLKFGREAINLEVEKVAAKLQVSPQQIIDWESGNNYPTLVQLRKLSKAYQREEVFFYLPEIPKKIKKRTAVFRMWEQELAKPLSPDLLILLEEACTRQSVAHELAEALEELSSIKIPHLSVEHSPESQGETLREFLNVPIENQFNWLKPCDALERWIDAVGDRGILVFKSSRSNVSLDEMRGFAIWDDYFPIIMLNNSDADNAGIFTLIYELVHLSLRQSDLFSIDTIKNSALESFCNHVAGSVLVPQLSLLRDPAVLLMKPEQEPRDEDLEWLADKFSVSQEVILRRLLCLGKVNSSVYNKKCSYLLRLPPSREKTFGRSKYAKQIIGRRGKLYIRLVFRALYEDLIELDEASRYLNSKLKHFKDLEEIVFD